MPKSLHKFIKENRESQAQGHLKDTLARLEKSESLLGSVIENAQHFGVYRITANPDDLFAGKVLLVSPSVADILGIDDPYLCDLGLQSTTQRSRTA